MAFRDRIEVVIDFVTTGAQTGLQKLRTDVAAADTATGKAKAGITAMGGALQQYGAQAALAAGAALLTFGAKSVQAFQDTTLAVDKFSTATGTSLEEASRLKGLSDELGISFDSLQSATVRMTTAVGNGTFDKLGLEAQFAKDGTLDVNSTLVETITTIGALASAEERNDAARRVFGKGFTDLTRLMEQDAESLYQKLEEHPDWEITTEEDARNAKELQSAMDALGDSVAEVQLIVARGLVPALTDIVETATAGREALREFDDVAKDVFGARTWKGIKDSVVDSLEQVANPIGWIADEARELDTALRQVASGDFGPVRDSAEDVSDALSEWDARGQYVQSRMAALNDATLDVVDSTDEWSSEMIDARTDAEQYADAMGGLNQRLVDAKEAVDNLVGEELSKIDAFQRAEDSARSYTESIEDYVLTSLDAEATEKDKADALRDSARAAIDAARDMATFKDGTYESVEGLATQITALEDMAAALGPNDPLRAELLAHIELLKGIQTEVETDVKFDVDDSSVVDVETARANAGRQIDIPVWLRIQNPTAMDEQNIINGLTRGGGASGGRGLVGGAIMTANGITQAAVDWWTGGRGGSEQTTSQAEKQRKKFDKEFAAAKVRYERGTFTADAYLAELRRLQAAYKWGKHSEPGMALWREIRRVNKEIKEAAAELVKENDGPGRDPWQQAAANQAAVEASQNLASTAASSMADLTDRDPNNDASALDAWAAAIWRDIEARADRKFDVKGRRWADFARKQLERAIAANPPLASRLRVYLLGIPSFGGGGGDDGGPGGPATTVRPPRGNGAVAGTGRMAGGTGSAGGSGGVTVVLNAPKALMVDRRALDEFAQMVTPAVMRETKRIRNGAG
jgi:hypothetical protein